MILSINVYADEYTCKMEGVSTTPPQDNSENQKSQDVPTNVFSNWANQSVSISGTTGNHILYSNVLFTGTNKLVIRFSRADEDITINLRKYRAVLSDPIVSTVIVNRLTADDISNNVIRVITFNNLSTSSKYYLEILPPAHFSGSVSNR